MKTGEFLLYTTEDGAARLAVRIVEETVWLTQKQLAELFQKDVRTVSEPIRNIYGESELVADSTIRNFRIVQAEGLRQVVRDGEDKVNRFLQFNEREVLSPAGALRAAVAERLVPGRRLSGNGRGTRK